MNLKECGLSKTRRQRRRAQAFTLIELLIVIAIIALLSSIMLPSLNRAKDLARSAICQGNLHQAGVGFAFYSAEQYGFIPGPNTSGYGFLKVGRPPSAVGKSNPIQSDDWMSPVLGRGLSLPDDPNARLLEIFNNKFRCPANAATYDTVYPSGALPANTRYNSYSAPLTLHVYWDVAQATANGQLSGLAFQPPYDTLVNVKPANHLFRQETLGSASMKVAAMDGARYVDTNGKTSYNTTPSSPWGCNFMNRGPTLNCFYQDTGEPYKYAADGVGLNPFSKKFAYRHMEKLNAVFFDGHAETMGHEASRNVNYWFPKNSVVVDTIGLGDKKAVRGQVVQ